MNRLSVRLSLAFTGVILIAVILQLATAMLLLRVGWELSPAAEHDKPLREFIQTMLFEAGILDEMTLPERALVEIPRGLVGLAVVGGSVGIVAGLLMSRRMTAPLNELAEAARAIGARDLSRRVTVKGTQEIMDVAQAFNQMAEELESAEILRQNLLADAAHELRTPISVIQGNLRAILDDVYPLEKEEVARLYDQTRHLTRLVDDLHELAQAEAHQLPLDLGPTDIAQLVRSTAGTFEPLAEVEEVSLRVEVSDDLPLVPADSARLTQVLDNLLINALRHTPAGGTITMRAGHGEDELVLAVQDTGEGIASGDIPHVFDRFYRADRSRNRDTGGTGLGLAIVRAIVEAHGGRVDAMSEGHGHGSTFSVYLPVQRDI